MKIDNLIIKDTWKTKNGMEFVGQWGRMPAFLQILFCGGGGGNNADLIDKVWHSFHLLALKS